MFRGVARTKSPRDEGVRSHPGWLLILLLFLGWFAGFANESRAQSTSGPVAPEGSPGHELFESGVIRTFKIRVERPALAVLEKNDRSYVRASITEGTNTLRDVAIRLKGMGSFRPFAEKPSFSVKFDHYVEGQQYLGLSKVMLNNSSQDPTYLAELMATQMFREVGVPAARVTHAFVEINDRALGLYVLIEAMNKDFLRQHFRNAKGNLYEAYLQDIGEKLDQDGGKDTSQTDLKRLVEVCRVADRVERWKRLPEVLDVDRYLSHLAVELFTSHTDGYAMNRNNYRLYHDPSSDRFVFLAHGIDWAFSNPGVSIRPPLNSIVTRAVLEPPQGRRQFNERVRQIYTNQFRIEVMTNRVNAAVARLQGAARTPQEAREFARYGADMRNRLVARHRNIAEQLTGPEPQPVKFDANGLARIGGWQPRKEQGDAAQDQPKLADKATLRIRVNGAPTVASWRTKVVLEEGRYRLEGLARTAQVMALTNTVERGNGAGVRVSGEKRKQELTGDKDWTRVEHAFEVLPGGDEKELVCELRANQGEVWFDVGSLRLVRLP